MCDSSAYFLTAYLKSLSLNGLWPFQYQKLTIAEGLSRLDGIKKPYLPPCKRGECQACGPLQIADIVRQLRDAKKKIFWMTGKDFV